MKVVGIATLTVDSGQNLNFFIPVSKLKKLVNKNLKQLKKINKENSIKNILTKAQKGDENSQFFLGFMYAKGISVKQDLKKAIYWLSKVKSVDSFATLGACYFILKNYKQAKKYFLISLENKDSLFGMSLIYLYGLDHKKDLSKAYHYMTQASFKGHLGSFSHLGHMNAYGLGVKKNLMASFVYFSVSNFMNQLKSIDKKAFKQVASSMKPQERKEALLRVKKILSFSHEDVKKLRKPASAKKPHY